ncbi:hypothetical protein Mapa_012194 [Marchantia paleacea]|nr:hypothetical protein Mapa_012194 [Marchantia paleacea]
MMLVHSPGPSRFLNNGNSPYKNRHDNVLILVCQKTLPRSTVLFLEKSLTASLQSLRFSAQIAGLSSLKSSDDKKNG